MWYYIVYCVLYCSFAQVAAQLALHSLTLSLQIILRPRQLVVKPSLCPPLPSNRPLHQCRVATASVYPVWGGAIGWVFPTVSLINPKVIISTRCRGIFPHHLPSPRPFSQRQQAQLIIQIHLTEQNVCQLVNLSLSERWSLRQRSRPKKSL